MPKQYFFSINLLIKDKSNIDNTVSSIIADEKFFLENVQLILIDSVCSDESIQTCSQYIERFPENIFFVDTSGKKSPASYNDAYSLCSGKYISFIDNYSLYSKKTLPVLMEILSGNDIDIDIAAISPFSSDMPYINSIPAGMVSLRDTPDKFILMLGCYFFGRNIINGLMFDTKLRFHSEDKFLLQALMKTYSFLFTENCSYTSFLPDEHNFIRFSPQYSKSFYTNALNDFIIPMLEENKNSSFVKSAMLYLINIKFALNRNDRYKYILNGDHAKDFFSAVKKALSYIDDGIILNKYLCRTALLDSEFPFSLLRIKYDNKKMLPDVDIVLFRDAVEKIYLSNYNSPVLHNLNGEFVLSANNAFISSSKDIFLEIHAINFDGHSLCVDAVLQNCSYIDGFSLYTLINQNKSDVRISPIYTTETFFDVPFFRKHSLQFNIPVSDGKQIDNACMIMKYQNLTFRLDMKFEGVFARLSTQIQSSFWCFGDKVLTYDEKTKSIIIRRATDSLMTFYEGKFFAECSRHLSFSENIRYRQIRKTVRHLFKEKNNFKYLVFYDNFGINSNGNLLFRYFSKARKNHKFIPFFITHKNSAEYNFLINSKYENVIEANSKKAVALILSADIIFAADCNVYRSLGFTQSDMLFLRDLFNAQIFSVKNFFATGNSPQFDNRIKDNIRKYFCASDFEKNNLLENAYGYSSDMIETTGYPILDPTFDKKEKLILISPGNRKQFLAYANSDNSKFSESKFFKIYNSLLTNESLLAALSEHEFKIAVLMPPSIEKYMYSFFSDENISFYSYTEKNIALLTGKAAVLITDYSELLYKMAYLNKPVIYYMPKNLPVQSEYKISDISENSLGIIISEHDKLIEYLVENIPQNFPQPEMYQKRCQNFFSHHDTKNCRRIFEAVIGSQPD